MKNAALILRIRAFLKKYAKTCPDDPTEYTSPDAYQLERAADLIEQGSRVGGVWSEWGSGGYAPYSSKEGREEHEIILSKIAQTERRFV